MIEFVHHDEARDLAALIEPIAATVPRSDLYWITTPNGTYVTNDGYFWCGDCGHYMVRHLRRRDRRHAAEYVLDGGWGTEEESLPRCVHCGIHLSISSLLRYGVLDELEYFRDHTFVPDDPSRAEDAYCLSEMLNAVAVTTDSDVQMAAEVIEITRRFLADRAIQETAP